jgi:hypothetical protein
MNLQSVISTLQYCLESFELCCQCGVCGPCTRGQEGIKQAIKTLENLTDLWRVSTNSVQYALERKGTRVEFLDRCSLLEFVRGLIPPRLVLSDDVTDIDIARIVAAQNWTFIKYEPGHYVQLTALLHTSVKTLHDLLLTTELNMDDLEAATVQELQKATAFEDLAALCGFSAKAAHS